MKSKNIRREGRGPKERRAIDDKTINVDQNTAIPTEEAKYRIVYGKHYRATVTFLEGPHKNKTATYDGKTNEWTGVKIPAEIKRGVERYYS